MTCDAIIYQGDRNYCITLKRNEDVTGYVFTVLNLDGTPYDLTGTFHKITIFHKENGAEFYMGVLTAATNTLTWTYKYTDIGLNTGTYYAEIQFTNATGDDKILTFGNLSII